MNDARTLSPKHLAGASGLAVLFGGPAIFMVERRVGPAGWLIALQDRHFGGHFTVSTVALVMLLELLCTGAIILLVAFAVRALTGRTLVQLLARQR